MVRRRGHPVDCLGNECAGLMRIVHTLGELSADDSRRGGGICKGEQERTTGEEKNQRKTKNMRFFKLFAQCSLVNRVRECTQWKGVRNRVGAKRPRQRLALFLVSV
jgi:hypothetical protein